jgi:hypothetical protein
MDDDDDDEDHEDDHPCTTYLCIENVIASNSRSPLKPSTDLSQEKEMQEEE